MGVATGPVRFGLLSTARINGAVLEGAKPSEEVHSDEVIDRVTCSKIGGPLEVGLRGVTGAAQSEA